jgi:hypothetical protein
MQNPKNAAVSARIDAQSHAISVAQASAQRQLTYQVALGVTGPAVAAFGLATAPVSVPAIVGVGGAEGAYLGSLVRGARGDAVTPGTVAIDVGLGAVGGLAGRFVVAPVAGRLIAQFSPAAEAVAPKIIQLSKARFGHAFARYGQDATEFLANRAASSGMPQGQFLDDQAAARFILDDLAQTKGGPVSLPIPKDLPARVIMPDGSDC